MLSLIDLLRTARLGPCTVGAPIAKVVGRLGLGEAFAVNRRGRPRGYAFLNRSLQVGVHDGFVVYFGLYFRYLETASEALGLLGIDRSTCWTRATTRAGIESTLTESGLVWRVRREDWGQALELDSGADILFDDEDGTLDSIQVANG